MTEVKNGIQRDIGRLEGRIEGLEKKVNDVDRHVSKLETKLSARLDHHSELSTKQHSELKDAVASIKMATQGNKYRIAILGGLLTGSGILGGTVAKFLPFLK